MSQMTFGFQEKQKPPIVRQIITSILFTLFLKVSFCQNYSEAYIYSFQHFIQVSEYADSLSFPGYTANPYFLEDIKNEIEFLCKEQFGVDFVIFNNEGIDLKYSSFSQKKIKRPQLSRNSSIAISIKTSLRFGSVSYDEEVYVFKTEIEAYNAQDIKIFSFTNKMPFVLMESEIISGQRKMSAKDFYDFYFDAIGAAFTGKPKKFEKRYIFKPKTDDYQDFFANSAKIYMTQKFNTYEVGKTLDTLSKMLEYEYELWKSMIGDSFHSRDLYNNFLTKTGFSLINYFDNITYTIRLDVAESNFFGYSKTENVDTELYRGKNLIGKFSYTPDHELEGIVYKEGYEIKWSGTNTVAEFYYEDELLVLVKEVPDYKIIHYSKEMKKQHFANFLTILFIYDFSLEVKLQSYMN